MIGNGHTIAPPRSFNTTRWSLVRIASGGDESRAMSALEELCGAYWYPVYAYIRRSGKSPHDAEDLTQGFFASLLARDTLATADPAKGRLRTFLLTCVRRYMAGQHDKAMALKRGAHVLSTFNAGWAEQRYATEPVDHMTPERLYQRRWALTVLEFSLQLAEEEFTSQGKEKLFAALRPFLGFQKSGETGYEEAAAALDMPVGTVKSHVSRLRERWRELLFEQVSITLQEPDSERIKEELAELLECV